jgi:hypothetical protein
MNINSWYIPKSEKGREVARALGLTYAVTAGRYVCNLPITLDAEQARTVAYILDPEAAQAAEYDAFETARRIDADPASYGIPDEDAPRVAENIRTRWPFGT